MKTAAIYARVSSDRQKEEQTIASQSSALRAYAATYEYVVPDGWIFEDEGWSGATLVRPGLERLRDLAAQGQIEVVLVYSPDRLSRKYAHQVLLLEEFARQGVDVVFLQGPRADTPEDVLLLQFQGMIAEYEKAQISERTRRGKRHRAQAGSVNALTGAPYGYRYVRKADGAPARYEIVESEAAVVREVFRRYTDEGESLGTLARWLTATGIRTRTGQLRWNKSSVWGMLRNPAYQGTACFQKTRQAERRRVNRRLRQRGGIPAHPVCSRPRPREEWIEIAVPVLVSPTQFALAQDRFERNRRFAARHTKQPSLLQGLLICQLCGYALYRCSSRSARHQLRYYRCTGADAYRFPQGRRCANRPVRQDVVEALVWQEVIQLLANPMLIRAEIDRRLTELHADHVGDVQRDLATKELARVRAAITRLIEAYQEQLISLDELRTRMPTLRQRETVLQTQLAALEAQLLDADTYVALAESLEGFLARLHDAAQSLGVADRQRVVRLVVKEVQVGPDAIVIKHSIPLPNHHPPPTYLLRPGDRDQRDRPIVIRSAATLGRSVVELGLLAVSRMMWKKEVAYLLGDLEANPKSPWPGRTERRYASADPATAEAGRQPDRRGLGERRARRHAGRRVPWRRSFGPNSVSSSAGPTRGRGTARATGMAPRCGRSRHRSARSRSWCRALGSLARPGDGSGGARCCPGTPVACGR
jgi:site-specific DNA recombinase